MKKIFTFTLSLFLIMSTVLILPVTVYAAPNNEQLGDYFKDFYYDENDILHKDIYDENGRKAEIDEEEMFSLSDNGVTIPSKYDSREFGNVTGVRDQNPLGSCWAFAFTAAAESSLVAQDYAEQNLDLSEAHLTWFRAANYVDNSTIPVQQDKICWIKDTFDDGGTDFDAVATAARWSGFALESDYPYVQSTNTQAMQFDSSEMFANNYNLVSARRLTKNNMNEVKQAIMTYGAVSSSMYYSADAVNYSANGCNHYQKKTSGVNHGVTVVGWDDNYPRTSFKTAPAEDGAWLVKNSWGTNANDGGYFWLSYKDKSCGEFMEVVAKPAGDYDNNYQYDGVYAAAAVTYSRTAYAANVFTANGYETVKGAGFYTFNTASYTCTVSVYTNIKNGSNPTSGTLRGSKTVSCLKEGYYTVDFDGEYNVAPGEKFAIVVKYYNPAGSAFIPYENLTNLDYEYTVQPGQSFYSGSLSNWIDVTTTANRGNIPIKAFTKDSDEILLTGISITSMPKTSYNADERFDLSGLTVTASYSDGSTGIISKEGLSITGFDSSINGTGKINIDFRGFNASYDYQIHWPEATEAVINTLPEKTEYYAGDEFDPTGLSLDVTFDNGTVKTVTDGFDIDVDMNRVGVQSVTVSYENVSTTFEITINAIEAVSAEISSLPEKLSYKDTDTELDTAGLEILVKYNNGSEEIVKTGFTCAGFDTSTAGTKTITVNCGEFTLSYEIEVVMTAVPTAIEIATLPKTEYYEEDEFTTEGLTLNLIYSDGRKEIIEEGFNVENAEIISGSREIQVEYEGFTAAYTINVAPLKAVAISIAALPKTQYNIGEQFTAKGLVLKVEYNNGTVKNITSGFSVYKADTSREGTKTVKVKYEKLEAIYTINVNQIKAVSISVSSNPDKMIYDFNEKRLDTTGLKIKVKYSNGMTETITRGFTCTGFDSSKSGKNTITVNYNGLTTTFRVTIKEAPRRVSDNQDSINWVWNFWNQCWSWFPAILLWF